MRDFSFLGQILPVRWIFEDVECKCFLLTELPIVDGNKTVVECQSYTFILVDGEKSAVTEVSTPYCPAYFNVRYFQKADCQLQSIHLNEVTQKHLTKSAPCTNASNL